VVKAGVIPQLRRGKLLGSDRWFIVEMLPGSQPLQELEDALLSVAVNRPEGLIDGLRANEHGLVNALKRLLPQDDSQLFLFIDQFEELFTLVEDEAMRAHFLASLLIAATEADSRLRLVIALRADFYDRPLLYPTFGTLIRMRTEVVLPLLPDELERAIAQPAERSGVALEDKLVKAIIADVGEQPGALPLLQYALTELFERREDHMMTLQAYNESGGVLGALARRADEIYERLDDDERKAARQLFLRLVTLGEGTEDTRRRVMQVELASLGTNKATMQAVIKEFGQYRLLTFDRDPATRSPTAEVAHEALIRQWARLREWLTDSREDVRLQRRIAAEAAEWVKSGREVSFLASGARLQQLEEWAQHTDLALNQTEQAYLHASLERRAQLAAQEAERKAHEELLERRSRERLRALVGVLLVAAVIGFGLSIFALNQRQAANANADNAATAAQVAALNADEAQGLALASSSELALSNNNTEQALALALANHHFDIPLAQRALYDAAYAPGIRQQMIGHVGEVLSVAYSPDGKTALSGSADTRLFLWDLSTGKTLRQFSGHSDWVQSVAFSPDGKTALSGSADHSVILWDIATGAVIRRLDGHQDAVWSVAFSPDGKTALSGSADNSLILWDIASGGVIRRYSVQNDSLSGPVYSVAFTPDGHSAVVGLGDGNVILWDVGKGTLIRKFGSEGKQHTTLVRGVAVRPDGKWALSGSGDRTVILWEIATGNFIRQFSGHSDWVMSVAFSPDGSMALSGSEDNKIILWNLSTTSEVGTVLHRFEGHNGKVNSVAFSPDGRTILSGASDNNLILWDLNSGAQLAHLGGMGVPGGHTDWATAVKFTPDGKNALSASVDGTLILWDLATGKPIRQFTQPDVKPDETPALWSFVFSPNGKTVLAAADDTTILEWDLASGQFLRHFKGHDNWVNTLTFSPDGRTFLSASGDHTLILWDYASGSIIRRFGANGEGHTDAVTGVRFSPDGRTAISSSYDNTLILWDVETGTVIRRFKGHDDWVNTVALSRDGKQALSGSNDATMILWDVATGSQIRRFREHTSAVLDVAFSPDGKTALSASADNSVIRWNLETGDALERLEGHNKPVDSVAFSPDGHTALSASYDNSVIWWRLDSLNELIQWVYANRYVRDLTCAERDQFRLSPCDSAGQFPTRTPYLTTLPTATDTATPTPDRTRTTATPQPTVTLTLTPPPTATPTHVPPAAQIGSHWGEVIVGDRDAWTYTGHAGDVLTIGTAADKPANGVSPDEGKRRGLLDTILILRAPDGSIVAQSDDIADGITDSRIDQAALPVDGTYVIEIHSYGDSEGGGYTLSITMNGTVTPTPAS
jgi:WD40 repeat protein